MAAKRKQMTKGSQYLAEAVLTDLLSAQFMGMNELEAPDDLAKSVAQKLVAAAWDVEHFPVAGKVQITLDLAELDAPIDQRAAQGPQPDAAHP